MAVENAALSHAFSKFHPLKAEAVLRNRRRQKTAALLIGVCVIAVVIAYWPAWRQGRAVATIREVGGEVRYDIEDSGEGWSRTNAGWWLPNGLIDWLGVDAFANVAHDRSTMPN